MFEKEFAQSMIPEMKERRLQNPVVWFKKVTDFTWDEVALVLGLPRKYPTAYIKGQAKKLPKHTVEILKEVGYPGDPDHDYQVFRENQTSELKEYAKELIQDWKEFYAKKGRIV